MEHPVWVRDVLSYWFEELTQEDWFSSKPATDETIRTRFLDLHARLQSDLPDSVYSDADAALAAIILFDQFSRNMFRGTASAFSTDSLALGIARNAVDKEFDAALPPDRRMFLYMPFMHSEVTADQEHCIQLFAAMGADTKYAVEHRDIVARYGRFPHRNKALGRQSTTDEIAFLEGHKGFGQ
ncbi:MAG: DUF924 domain-containing protein [Rhizobiaceae bacterium]|nr:DUF924 domain-containing protein [Rhizobiaceae bacterium]